jgi:hypothetical protein
MRTLRALRDYLTDLFDGDPVALTFTGVMLGIALLLGLLVLKAKRDLRREDEERQRKRYGGKKKETKR